MKPVKKFPVLLIVSVVLCALGYVLRPLMPGLADMFRHLGFIWIGYGVFALLLKLPKETRARTVCSLTREHSLPIRPCCSRSSSGCARSAWT